MPELNTTSDGMSVDQLRRQKRQRRKISENVAWEALPESSSNPSVVTDKGQIGPNVVTPILKNENKTAGGTEVICISDHLHP